MKLARSSTLLAGLLAGQLLVLSAPLALASPASAAVVTARTSASAAAASYGESAYDTTNQQRTKRDRRSLGRNACLRKFAGRQARAMANRESIWHQNLGAVLTDCHMSFVGENVAAGFSSGRAVVNDGWMKSATHRENLLNRKFRLMTVAAHQGGDGRWYVAQVFGKR